MASDLKEMKVILNGSPDRSYPILIGTGLFERKEIWEKYVKGGKVFIVTDKQVGPLYTERLCAALGREAQIYAIEAGEKSKSFSEYQKISEWMLENGVNRHSLIIALGGGVVGDLTGFVAATVMRGVTFIQIPTTLLAQVDSSVGGKTGINSRFGKNLIGAFNQPAAVVIDVATLKTLPKREILAGYAEIAKYGLLGDAGFFEWLEQNGARLAGGDENALVTAIEKSCRMKADIVREDEFEETGLRALLNLGHTFAHALETACDYDGRLLHGEAVGIGLVLAARLSQKKGYILEEDVARVEEHLRMMGMMTEIRDITPRLQAGAEELMALMRKDKKATAKGLNFVVLEKLGHAKLDGSVSENSVMEVLEGSI